MPRELRVFLASPGDVADERALVIRVLDELNYDPLLRDKLRLEVVAWDHPSGRVPMLSGMSAQDSVIRGRAKPSKCDIAVIILWSRLGSCIRCDGYEKPDGTGYYTGTEWEYEDALHGFKAQGKPLILRYHRTESPKADLSTSNEAAIFERLEQLKRVDAFLASCKARDGSIANEYEEPNEFKTAFKNHLKELIRPILDSEAPTAEPTTSHHELAELWPGSPFPGLHPFTDQDAPIFFGREREIDDLIRKLRDPVNRFITVVGASGSGKSSLVWAGLIPRLKAGAIEGSQDWGWVRFTPGELGDNPFLALTASLKSSLGKQRRQANQVANELYENHIALDELVQWAMAGKPVEAKWLLFIDQFEELLTRVDSKYQSAFIGLLSKAARMDRIKMIVTIRADFYHRWLEHPLLRERLAREQLERGHFPLLAPGTRQLYDMITRPAERAGLTFECDLPERILDDTGTDVGALPLMAFALEQLYKAKTTNGHLTHAAYETFDGVHGAIGKRADEAFEALTPEVRAQLGNVFLGLLEVDEQGVATRRRAPLNEVARSQTEKALVRELTNARLLVTDETENEAHEPMVEVAHEALFRSWPRLAEWIQTTADDHRLRRQITQLAQYWESHERRDEHRWPDGRVVEVVDMLGHLGLDASKFSKLEQDFLGPLDRDHMLAELEHPDTSHERRAIIGVRLSLLGDSRPGVGLRKDDLPDIVWCEVPGGKIALEIEEEGSSFLKRWLGRSRNYTFKVDPFYIAKYPITWIQYRAFVEADDGFYNPAWWQGLWFQVDKPGRQFNRRDNHPAENLCWLEAVAYCRWLSEKLGFEVRLPTEWEWQQSATGGDGTKEYPWGREWDSDLPNTYESELNRSTAVGLYPEGASPVGALDMCGNVFEWCLNEYDNPSQTTLAGDARRVVRGGSWLNSRVAARAACRSWGVPFNRSYDVGFRVVCSSPI